MTKDLLQFLNYQYEKAREDGAEARKDRSAFMAEYYAGMKQAYSTMIDYVRKMQTEETTE